MLSFGLAGAVTAIAVVATVTLWRRWGDLRRARTVRRWLKQYVGAHYGRVHELKIHCSGDPAAPIAVEFSDRPDGLRHRLVFRLRSGPALCRWQSETRESIMPAIPRTAVR